MIYFILLVVLIFAILFVVARYVKNMALKNKGKTLDWLEKRPEIPFVPYGLWYLVFVTENCPACNRLKVEWKKSKTIKAFYIYADKNLELVRNLKVAGVPTTFIMDKDKVTDVRVGFFLP